MVDIVYINLVLFVYIDMIYFIEFVCFQVFYMLLYVGMGDFKFMGGKLFFVDGFKVVEQIWVEFLDKFVVLVKFKILWYVSGNEGIVIVLDVLLLVFELLENDRIFRVWWNNDDWGIVFLDKDVSLEEWYQVVV